MPKRITTTGLRRQMIVQGWTCKEQLTPAHGMHTASKYSVWFIRHDWHGMNTRTLTGNPASYQAGTRDLSQIDRTLRRAARLAKKAWTEYPEAPPIQCHDGSLEHSYVTGEAWQTE